MRTHFKVYLGLVLTLVASIAIATLWNLVWFPSPNRQPQSVSAMTKTLVSIEELNNWNQDGECNCNYDQFNAKDFKTVPESSCRSERLVYNNRLKQLPERFREHRKHGPFPKECITFVMNRFGSNNTRSGMFANCGQQGGRPSRLAFKPCVSDNYVNSVYNVFTDMSSCLQINPKFLMPKIAQESGFHLNAFGKYDTGLGQLTGSAIEHVNRGHFRAFQNFVGRSNQDSCKRINPLISAQIPVGSSVANRCSLINPPQNPALNLFYSAVLFQVHLQELQRLFRSNGIESLLKQAGLNQFDPEKIKFILLNLAYNTGPGGAMANFRTFLRRRVELKARGGPSLQINDLEILGSTSKSKRSDINTFEGFLHRHQRPGTKGYLSNLKNNSNELDRAFAKGTCTMDNYLELSK